MEDGTGIVHIAPGFGADDHEVGKEHGLPVLQAIGTNGIFKDFAKPYNGMYIKDADKEIVVQSAPAENNGTGTIVKDDDLTPEETWEKDASVRAEYKGNKDKHGT